jgi:hypothetical protein
MKQCKSRLTKITHRLVRLREQLIEKADRRPASRSKSANVIENSSRTDDAIDVGLSGSYHPRGDDRLAEAYQDD